MITVDFKVNGMNGRFTDIRELRKGLKVGFYGFENKEKFSEFTEFMKGQIEEDGFIGEYTINNDKLTYTIMRLKTR